MKIAFLGTPEFAIPSLVALLDGGHEVTVFTQPDKNKGRGKKLLPTPVKEYALERGISVFQFPDICSDEGIMQLRSFAPDLAVTAAFGQILTAEFLSIPKLGCVNVHASLLPEYRGAAPIQRAIIDGRCVTGVTTMMTDIGLDTGDILLCKSLKIGENETAGELTQRLAALGAEVLLQTIEQMLRHDLVRTPQDNSKATKCRTIKKEHARIDFSRTATEIHNLVRGMNPAPTAFAFYKDEVMKIHATRVLNEACQHSICGKCVIANKKEGLIVATGSGLLEIIELQFPSGRKMTAREAMLGHSFIDEVLL